MNLLFDNKFENFCEVYNDGTYIFVELKNSAEFIREYVVYHRGKTIDGSL